MIISRDSILTSLIAKGHVVAGRKVPDDYEMDLMLTAYGIALEDVPTEHLDECFKRAVRAKRDSYVVSGVEMRQQWLDLKVELREQAKEHAIRQEHLLMSGQGSLGKMTLAEWKAKHNLPAEWQLGQPYPPQSDLLYRQAPAPIERLVACQTCKDAGWVVDRQMPNHPMLVRCNECGGQER